MPNFGGGRGYGLGSFGYGDGMTGYGAGPYGADLYGTHITFTPPTRRQVVKLEGSLRYSFEVSSTVWKDANGVWHAQENPYDGDLVAAQIVIARSGPVQVSPDIADELVAAGIGTIE